MKLQHGYTISRLRIIFELSTILMFSFLTVFVNSQIYPLVLTVGNDVGYLDLDYHPTSGIILGGFCEDSSHCCTNCPDGIIEKVGEASKTV
jgi:hypothetical protein